MNYIINDMIQMFDDNVKNNKNVLREVLQKIILYALYKTPLGSNLCFIGGTCLRIFYKINRFSQDLDFILVNPEKLSFKNSLEKVNEILQSFGLKSEYYIKSKTNENNMVVVYFKFDLQNLYDNYYPNQKWKVTNGQTIKIELDLDTTKYQTFKIENKFELFPQYFQTQMFDLPTLFASKIAAILLRSWNKRGFKGRDLYDLIFYVSIKAKINFDYLKEKLIIAKKINNNDIVDIDYVKNALIEKFNEIDFKQAKNDVEIFISDVSSLDCWTKEMFIDIAKNKLI